MHAGTDLVNMSNAQGSFGAKAADTYGSSNARVQFKYGLELVKQLKVGPGKIVLDIGCGTGELAAYCAREVLPGGCVVAADPNKERICVAKDKFNDLQHLQFFESKSVDFPIDIPYDIIICNAVMHWVPDDEKLPTFKRMFASLKPRGLAGIICGPEPPLNMALIIDKMSYEMKEKYSKMVHPLPKNALEELVKEAGFDILSSDSTLEVAPWPNLHEYLEWMDATLYGKLNFKTTFENFKDQISLTKYDDGTWKHETNGIKLILQKPET